MKKITLYGTDLCGDCKRSKFFLEQNNIPYTYVNIEKDKGAYEFVVKTNNGFASTPTIVIVDEQGKETILVEPTNDELKKAISVK